MIGPCDILPCPDRAACIDESDDIAPKYRCECQMGLVEEGGRCIGKLENNIYYLFRNFYLYIEGKLNLGLCQNYT